MQTTVRRAWRDWIIANAIAALAAIGIGAAVASRLLRLFEVGWFGIASSSLVFGVTAGAAFGILQHRVLRNMLPFLKADTWVVWTGFGATLTWLVVAVPMPQIFGDTALAAEPGWWLRVEAVAAVALGMGLLVGVCQWFALREWVRRPWRWMFVNLAAWALASPLLMWAAADVYEMGPPVAPLACAGVVLLAGAVVGAVGGRFVEKMVVGNDDGGVYAQQVLGDLGSIDLSE